MKPILYIYNHTTFTSYLLSIVNPSLHSPTVTTTLHCRAQKSLAGPKPKPPDNQTPQRLNHEIANESCGTLSCAQEFTMERCGGDGDGVLMLAHVIRSPVHQAVPCSYDSHAALVEVLLCLCALMLRVIERAAASLTTRRPPCVCERVCLRAPSLVFNFPRTHEHRAIRCGRTFGRRVASVLLHRCGCGTRPGCITDVHTKQCPAK